ncbi:MAG: hypothetical protein RXO23_04585, partial [Vulcanisaeta sp.]
GHGYENHHILGTHQPRIEMPVLKIFLFLLIGVINAAMFKYAVMPTCTDGVHNPWKTSVKISGTGLSSAVWRDH